MSRHVSYSTVVQIGAVCWLAAAASGCVPPEPADVGIPASAGSTADWPSPGTTAAWPSPGITAAPAVPPIQEPEMKEPADATSRFPVQKTEDEWKALLTPEQYKIARLKSTERAFTGKYWNTKTPGTYQCVCCGRDLFVSDAKFDSGCGWPSFFQAVDDKAIVTQPDYSIPPPRVEIMCGNCGAHLGHVFEDGPPPTGLRFCVNSASVKLVELAAKESEE